MQKKMCKFLAILICCQRLIFSKCFAEPNTDSRLTKLKLKFSKCKKEIDNEFLAIKQFDERVEMLLEKEKVSTLTKDEKTELKSIKKKMNSFVAKSKKKINPIEKEFNRLCSLQAKQEKDSQEKQAAKIKNEKNEWLKDSLKTEEEVVEINVCINQYKRKKAFLERKRNLIGLTKKEKCKLISFDKKIKETTKESDKYVEKLAALEEQEKKLYPENFSLKKDWNLAALLAQGENAYEIL